MNQTGPTMNPPLPRWRTSLPIALLVAGVALSVSTACITSAVVQSAQRSATAKRMADEAERERTAVELALTPFLPPPGANVPAGERLSVIRGFKYYTIVAMGEFTPQNSAALAAAARGLYAQTVSFDTRFDLRTFRRDRGSRVEVAHFELNLADELVAELRPALPPAGSKVSAGRTLWATHSGDGQTLYVSAVGEFTPEAVTTFTQAVIRARASRSRPPQFVVTMMRPGTGGQGNEVVARFDSSKPGTLRP